MSADDIEAEVARLAEYLQEEERRSTPFVHDLDHHVAEARKRLGAPEPRTPLHQSDKARSPEYLEGRQDGINYAAQVLDAYRQKYARSFCAHSTEHFRIVSQGLHFGQMMLDLNDGRMPPPDTAQGFMP